MDGEIWRGNDHFTNPIPDILRIPCRTDDVLIGLRSSVKLNLDFSSSSFMVRSFAIGPKTYRSYELSSVFSSKIGKLAFKTNNKRILLSNLQASLTPHTQDIYCTNALRTLTESICVHSALACREQKPPAFLPNNSCVKKMQPNGFCCPLCAILIKIQLHPKQTPTVYDNLVNLVSNLHVGQDDHSRFFVQQLTNDSYEIIIVNPDLKQAHEFGHQVYQHLSKGLPIFDSIAV